MKFAIAATTWAALLHLPRQQADAAPAVTCAQQAECISFTQTSLATGTCGEACAYQVCLTLNLGGNCVKSSLDQISHTCYPTKDSADPQCNGPDFAWTKDESSPDGYTMCQTGSPGEVLHFIVKDGSATDTMDAAYNFTTNCGTVTVDCHTAGSDYQCGGGLNRDYERLWTYTVPDDGTCTACPAAAPPSPTDPTPTDPAPAPSPSAVPPPAPQCSVATDCTNPPDDIDAGCLSAECVAGTCIYGGTQGQTCDASDKAYGSCYTGGVCGGPDSKVCVPQYREKGESCYAQDGAVLDQSHTAFDGDCKEYVCAVLDPSDIDATQTGGKDISAVPVCKAFPKLATPCDYTGAPVSGACFDSYKCCSEELNNAGLCGLGSCYPFAKPSTHECRSSAGDCDQPELCTGNTGSLDQYDCPADLKHGDIGAQPKICRSSCPDCASSSFPDPEETCPGGTNDCPVNVVFEESLCLVAGQTYSPNNADKVDMHITEEEGTYTFHMLITLVSYTLQPAAQDAIKVHVDTEEPGKIGQYPYKFPAAGIVHLGNGQYSLTIENFKIAGAVCGSTGFYVAVHLDVIDENGEEQTSWAYDCNSEMGGIQFMTEGKKPKPRAWGRYFHYTPCCADQCSIITTGNRFLRLV